MDERQITKQALQRSLDDLARQERQLRTAIEDYPSTEYARIAEEKLKKLPVLKADTEKQIVALEKA